MGELGFAILPGQGSDVKFKPESDSLTELIGSTIIQIPAIHNSTVYPWLTIFQLMRFYRVILEIPRMKPLLVCA